MRNGDTADRNAAKYGSRSASAALIANFYSPRIPCDFSAISQRADAEWDSFFIARYCAATAPSDFGSSFRTDWPNFTASWNERNVDGEKSSEP